jgi:bifunctional ADP-heptose synthase (sugar kinase/adenylyltransferase)
MIITVIGESCSDIYIYGITTRLSPEAPVPVIKKNIITNNNGMAGNVVDNLLSINQNNTIHLVTQKSEIKKTRFVDYKTNHMFIRYDEGEDNIDSFILDLETSKLISQSDITIVSDYNKGYLTNQDLVNIGNLSKLSILDSKRKLNQDIISSFDFVKLNEIEYVSNKDVCEKFKNKVLKTLGMNGCEHTGKIYPTTNQIFTMDVSGAGDTFTASFILKYKETNDVETAIMFANSMASIVVSKRGVRTPTN